VKHPVYQSKWMHVFALLFVAISMLFAYTFFHEGGHALFGILFGGTLTRFSVDFITFSAHVGLGGDFTTVQRAIISAAGVGLPIILWTVFLLLARKPDRDNFIHFWLMLFGSVMSYSALIAWVIIPILAASGQTVQDDSANFLRITGAPPLLVSGTALLVLTGGMSLYFYKMGWYSNWVSLLRRYRKEARLSQSSLLTLRILAVGSILLGVATVGINTGVEPGSEIPNGYELVFEADFQSEPAVDAVYYEFNLEQPAEVRFFLILENFNQAPLVVRLSGPDGFNAEFLRFQQAGQIGHATVHPDPFQLNPGNYQIRVTAQQEKSTIQGYMRFLRQ
jgi:hypothetical protein